MVVVGRGGGGLVGFGGFIGSFSQVTVSIKVSNFFISFSSFDRFVLYLKKKFFIRNLYIVLYH